MGKQLSRYVCLRITRLDDVDVGLFERDWNNAIYFFAMNGEEQIYFRYGGRDSASPDTYLNLDSLGLALRQGMEMHQRYLDGALKLPPRPKAFFPREIPLLVRRTFAQRQCVECHLIGDFQNIQREQDGVLDKVTHLYRSPDIKTLGIELDVPKGLVVKQGPGMQAGDRITSWNGVAVLTFGDLQYQFDKVDRKAKTLTAEVDRGGTPVKLEIALPERWWWTDLRFRQSSVDPRLDFEDRPLSAEEKGKLGLPADGFASRVKYVSDFAKIRKTHELRVGDIIYAVDKVERDELANTAELFLKLRRKSGAAATLGVIRDGKRIEMPIKTYQLSFRK